MDYEKEYKKKLEDAKYWHDCSEGDIPAILEEIFSELKESNDEEIRKAISYAIANSTHEDGILINGVTESEAIAWLEKQGKYKFEHGDDNATKVFKNEDGTHSNISQLERVAKKVTETEETAKEFLKSAEIINENGELAEEYRLEKQGEPKFKVGDWVARGNVKAQIIGIEDNKYCFDGYKVRCSTIDKHYHLWTIQDAKDGDVLVASDSSIFIFKEVDDNSCKHYIALTSDKVIKVNVGLKHYWETARGVKPATKEQRDLLFQKMHEAGYEWDADKKELSKIEDNPVAIIPKFKVGDIIRHKKQGFTCRITAIDTEYRVSDCCGTHLPFDCQDYYELVDENPAWSEEDEIGLGDALWAIKQARTIAKDENEMGNLWYAERWLELLKKRMKGE